MVWHYGWDERVMELDNLGGVKKAQAMYMKLDVVIVDGRANEEMMQSNRYGLLRKPLRQKEYHDQNIGNSFWSTLWLGW